jgi:WhiB family transcriptional regulator, redox-sensing transcriptional regulator
VKTRTTLTYSPGALGPLLPDPAGDLSWQDAARCAETDPEVFFPEKGGSTREARKVCRECEVRAECLEYALKHESVFRFGVWGGLSERERRALTGRRASGQAA